MPGSSTQASDPLADLTRRAGACVTCADHLPLGPRPVFRLSSKAKLVIIGQAPGTKVHASGIPWNDPSGDRLRDWMGVDRETFYTSPAIAIVPMGFCYPGRLPKGGDAPPRPECAPQWHQSMLDLMPEVECRLLVGSYAQRYYLASRRYKTMTETVRMGADFAPDYLPLPHPSWRNTAWIKKNPWFETDSLPVLRDVVDQCLR